MSCDCCHRRACTHNPTTHRSLIAFTALITLFGCGTTSFESALLTGTTPADLPSDVPSLADANDVESRTEGDDIPSSRAIGNMNATSLKATSPSPVNGATAVMISTSLRWSPGAGAIVHDIYLGTSAAAVRAASRGAPEYRGRAANPAYSPVLSPNQTYFWRIDEIGSIESTTGDVWQFSTNSPPGSASGFWPPHGSVHVSTSPLLTWVAGGGATSHNVFIGTSYIDVLAATTTSPTFMGSRSVASYAPSALPQQTTHYWRIDEVGLGGTTRGPVLSFVTRPPPLPAPIVSPEYEVTDRSLGHTVGNSPNPECSNFTRIDNSLYFLYRSATPLGLFVRRFDLASNVFSPSVLVDAFTDPANNGYHSEPTLLRNGAGALHVLNQYSPMIVQCRGAFGSAPRHRVIPDITKPGTWTVPECFPSRVATIYNTQFYDAMGVYDSRAGMTHAVGQSYGFAWLDGQPNDGFPRTYYRINNQGVVDGPYIIVEAATGNIPEIPTSAVGASIFSKGDLVLGREASGTRSLHVVWSIRAQWTDGSTTHQCNANLYYARSIDGGNIWTNASNTASVSLLQHIKLNDGRFLAFAGDVDQDSERAFDIDAHSRPVMAIKKVRPGTGVVVGNRVDVLASPPPQYDLYWRRWTGTTWIGSVINTTTNWANQRPKVRVDADDNIYVFVGDLPAYYVSKNGGNSWTGPVVFGTKYSNSRIYSSPDPIDPNFHLLAYTDRHELGLYFVRIQLTNP